MLISSSIGWLLSSSVLFSLYLPSNIIMLLTSISLFFFVPFFLLVYHLSLSTSVFNPPPHTHTFFSCATWLFLSPSPFLRLPTLMYNLPCSLSLSIPLSLWFPSSGGILLHDQSLSGSGVWGGSGPVFLLGHHLCWSHVHPGSHWDPSGEFHL